MLMQIVCALLIATSAVSAEEAKPLRAIAVLRDPNGGPVLGNVTFTQNGCGNPVLVEVSVTGLTPGLHGFHIHEKGDLSNGCMSTGGHYNPDKVDHGAPKGHVRHVGDLGNVMASNEGFAQTKDTDEVITLTGSRSIVGRAVVVHEKEDDLGQGGHPDSKKTGNAGGRVACGVIGIVSPSNEEWPCSSSHRPIASVFAFAVVATVSMLFTFA